MLRHFIVNCCLLLCFAFWTSCNNSEFKLPIFTAGDSIIIREITAIANFEKADFMYETTETFLTTRQTIGMKLYNGQIDYNDKTALDSLFKGVAKKIKLSIENVNQYDSIKVIFIKTSTDDKLNLRFEKKKVYSIDKL